MTAIGWALRPLKHYADFNGRAPRAEYWCYSLAAFVAGVVVDVVDRFTFGPVYGDQGPLAVLFTLAVLIPGAAVAVRRLHDIDRSGWWFLLNVWSYFFLLARAVKRSAVQLFDGLPSGAGFLIVLAVLVCVVMSFIFMITPGTEGENRYGSDPYGPDHLEEVFA